MASELHRQSDRWDRDMEKCPTMYCGRLDMATWDARTGERQKMVYFDGEEDYVICVGSRADYVAYAANRYQPLVEQLTAAHAEVEKLRAENKHMRKMLIGWGSGWTEEGLDAEIATALNTEPNTEPSA